MKFNILYFYFVFLSIDSQVLLLLLLLLLLTIKTCDRTLLNNITRLKKLKKDKKL